MRKLLLSIVALSLCCIAWGPMGLQIAGMGVSSESGDSPIFNVEFEGSYTYPTYTMGGDDVSDGDTTGTTTNDAHVFVQDTIAKSGYALKVDSGYNVGLTFTVSSDDIFNSDIGYLRLQAYSSATPTGGSYFFTSTPGSNRFNLYQNGNDNLRMRWYGGDGSNTITIDTTDELNVAEWNQIDVRWSVADNKLDVRINGGTWQTSTASMTTFATDPIDINIGPVYFQSSATVYVDDVSIWDTFTGPGN